jgi:hypothetical protein
MAANQVIIVVTRANPTKIHAYHPTEAAETVTNNYDSRLYRAYYSTWVNCKPGDTAPSIGLLQEITLVVLNILG